MKPEAIRAAITMRAMFACRLLFAIVRSMEYLSFVTLTHHHELRLNNSAATNPTTTKCHAASELRRFVDGNR